MTDRPSEFGRYRIRRELGRGGMGVVYEAEQPELGRTVALKLIAPDRLRSVEDRERFRREARAAARVRHPGIIAIYDVGTELGQDFIAMEFVPGRSLEGVLADGGLPANRAAELVAHVARAVQCLHDAGLVHRDLKPSNILLDLDGQPRVTDFGLALHTGETDGPTGIVGTPGSLAPEQVSSRFGAVGPRTDVYGLGSILYQLLLGNLPHRGDSTVDLVLNALEHDPEPLRRLAPGVPPELEAICMRCLERRPEARYESAAAVASDLRRFLRDEPLEVAPPGLGRKLVRWTRRRPALAAHTLGLTAFLGLLNLNRVLLGAEDAAFFVQVSVVLVAWLVVSIVLDRWTRGPRAALARYGWATVDCVLFAYVVSLGDGVASAMVVIFPFLVVSSGAFLRERLVRYVTALTIVLYLGLALESELVDERPTKAIDHHLIVVLTLVLTGVVVHLLVRRVRLLADYARRTP